MPYYKIAFANGSIIGTSFNGDLPTAIKYYLNNFFELAEGVMTKAINVEKIS